MSSALKVGGSLLAAFALCTGGVYSCSPRITDRYASMKVVRGKVVDSHVESGVKMDAILPHVEYVKLPKWQLETTIKAGPNDAQTVRTAQKARIFGNYTVAYEFDDKDANFGNIYTKLKIDEADDIKANLNPKINALGISAVIDVYGKIDTANIDKDIPGTGKKITERLQQYLNDYGFTYVRVKYVVPSGVGLSPKANEDLEQLVSEQRKLDLQKAQGATADAALSVTEKQAAVTARALQRLREAGVPEDQLISAYCLQLMRDNDKIGTPGAPGCIPGTGIGMVPGK